MPDIKTPKDDGAYFMIGDNIIRPGKILSTQYSVPGSGSNWGAFALVLWTSLLALGCWGTFAISQHRRFRIVLGLTLLGQLMLHLLYGQETFLYSLHFAPLLVLLAALSTLTRARVIALIFACGLLLCAGINNGFQFVKARELVQQTVAERHKALSQMLISWGSWREIH